MRNIVVSLSALKFAEARSLISIIKQDHSPEADAFNGTCNRGYIVASHTLFFSASSCPRQLERFRLAFIRCRRLPIWAILALHKYFESGLNQAAAEITNNDARKDGIRAGKSFRLSVFLVTIDSKVVVP